MEDAAAVGEDLNACSDLKCCKYFGFFKACERGIGGERCTSAISDADSRTRTEWPARRIEIAAPSPPSPAPTTITYGIRTVLAT